MEIVKQKLLSEPLSQKAVKFARAIYFAHLKDETNLYLEIKIASIMKLLGVYSIKEAVEHIIDILTELNEPLAVRNFEFYGKVYPIRFVTFCKYNICGDTLEIELNEEFLHAESNYMLDSFLTK
jgi:hypothetical protein